MKVNIKIAQFNGTSPINEFNTISELKTYLNEMLYYASELILNIECNYTDNWNYREVTDIASIVREAKFYNSIICVNVIHD